MASAAGGSGGGQDNRRSSRGKDKNQVGPKVDKPSKNWLTAQLRYLEATHEEYVAAGEEPPFNIESLRLRYLSAPTPPNPAATAPPSCSTERKIILQCILMSHPRVVEGLCLVFFPSFSAHEFVLNKLCFSWIALYRMFRNL